MTGCFEGGGRVSGKKRKGGGEGKRVVKEEIEKEETEKLSGKRIGVKARDE